VSDAAAQRDARTRQHVDRWSAFGASSGISSISNRLDAAALRRIAIFEDLPDDFLEELSPDVSLAEWQSDAVLFEEGSFLDLAFYILDGEVDLFLQRFDPGLAQAETLPPSATRRAESPAGRTVFTLQVEAQERQVSREGRVAFLTTLDVDFPLGERLRLGPGEVFGEIGALNGWPQSVTARVASTCRLVQIRLPALRKLKRKSKALKTQLDDAYRSRTLFNHLQTTPLLRGVNSAVLEALIEKVELVSYEPGTVITRLGETADAIYLVRSGFLKLSQSLGEAEIVVTYLSKGTTLGEVEMLIDGLEDWQYSATAVGHCELVKISTAAFREVVRRFPAVERRLWESAVARIKEAGYTRKSPTRSKLTEFALAKGLVQGSSMLVIDLDVCTRCDDCVRGCASTHAGRPRFIREGEKHGGFLVTRSCYHCDDPVCLIGCPTGAIRRTNVGQVVAVDDALCIGCGTCAGNCPYDAIVMYDTGRMWPDDALPVHLAGEPRLVASKCDLCYTSEHGPACVTSCPHSCAFRIGSLAELDDLVQGR
jgi:CRP-like cAMP-binding protein/Fe-S-cluster-containing dehydrogenase component